MNSDDKFSDEKLHLFIDDELDSADRAEIMEALGNDDRARLIYAVDLENALRNIQSDRANFFHGRLLC